MLGVPLSDYDLEVFDTVMNPIGSSAKGIGIFDLVSLAGPSGLNPNVSTSIYIRVKPCSIPIGQTGNYFLDIDFP